MQNFTGEIAIVSIATVFVLLITVTPILFVFMHQRQYHRYLTDKEQIKNAYQRELLQSQLEIQNQTLQQVGNDLHDNIGQLLTVVIMRLNTLEDNAKDSQSRQSVQQTRDLVRTIIADIRALSKTLDYDTVRRFGLSASLTLELDRVQRTGRIHTDLVTVGEEYSLGEQAEIVLLRMAQESINNALKHARANTLTVLVEYKPDNFILTIVDNGQGFLVEEVATRTLDKAGSGLNSLQRRTGMLSGTCTIDSRLGEGTRIQIQLPRNRVI